MSRQYAFSGYRLDAVSRELSGPDGAPIALASKALDVLLQLIEHRDRVLGKEELLAAVWPGRVVEENNLTQAVSALRKALGVGAGDHRYIVTVPGRGYRFVAALDAPGNDRQALDCALQPTVDPPIPAAVIRSRALAWTALAVVVLAATLVATIVRAPRSTVAETSAPVPTTLAVLPFRSIGQGARDEMLELGMAETLIARLSRSTSMRILSMGSVQGFAGAKLDPLRAGKALGADYVVEGSTEQRGEYIRVNARLLALPNGQTVWAGTFDQIPSRVFTLQDVLAEGVTSALSLQYAAATRHHSPCDGADADAYRAYLRGRYLSNRPNAARLATALAAFREAIDRDPGCARAWAGIAFAQRALVMTGDRQPRAVFPLAKAAVAQALAIDAHSAEAYSSRGFIQFWYDWDWAAAEASLRHALALDPNLSEAHFALARLLDNLGRNQEAVSHARLAVVLDPLSPLVNTVAAQIVDAAGQTDEAHRRLDTALELEPDFWRALLARGGMALARRDSAGAIVDLRRAAELCKDCSQALAELGRAHALAGDRRAAEQVLADLQRRDRIGYMPATSLATLHNALGDRERALDLLERAYRERDVRLSFLKVDPRWNNLRAHPRFRALLQRMNLQGGLTKSSSSES